MAEFRRVDLPQAGSPRTSMQVEDFESFQTRYSCTARDGPAQRFQVVRPTAAVLDCAGLCLIGARNSGKNVADRKVGPRAGWPPNRGALCCRRPAANRLSVPGVPAVPARANRSRSPRASAASIAARESQTSGRPVECAVSRGRAWRTTWRGRRGLLAGPGAWRRQPEERWRPGRLAASLGGALLAQAGLRRLGMGALGWRRLVRGPAHGIIIKLSKKAPWNR
jgi:hypothetical protein